MFRQKSVAACSSVAKLNPYNAAVIKMSLGRSKRGSLILQIRLSDICNGMPCIEAMSDECLEVLTQTNLLKEAPHQFQVRHAEGLYLVHCVQIYDLCIKPDIAVSLSSFVSLRGSSHRGASTLLRLYSDYSQLQAVAVRGIWAVEVSSKVVSKSWL
jgi:hypothetical protein